MANPANKFLLTAAVLSSISSIAVAQDYTELSRSDFITIDAGDAPQSNIAIQTPTPWPDYINDTDIPMSVYGTRGVGFYDEFYRRGKKEAAAPTTLNINLPGAPGQ